MKLIRRAIAPIIEKRHKSCKCLLLTGPRQVGKTTLLKSLFKDYSYVTFDDIFTRAQVIEDPKLFLSKNPCPLFIDEVQKRPEILEQIKIVADNTEKKGLYLFSGSQRLELIKGARESLAGRVSISELCGLSLREIFNVDFNDPFIPSEEYISKREKSLVSYDGIWDVIHRGSYPELYENQDRDWADFYYSYYATYVEKDVLSLISADEITFSNFTAAVAARTGELLNCANIAREVGISEPTVKKWLSILERTGIIYLLQPYSSNALNRAIKTPKIYFRDTGLACFIARFLTSDTLKNSYIAGNMFETFIVNEIIKSFANAGENYQFSLYYYRGKDKTKKENEIDLVIDIDGVIYPIEIKKTGKPKASMADANTILDKVDQKKRGLGVILCLVDNKIYLRDNLVALPLSYI